MAENEDFVIVGAAYKKQVRPVSESSVWRRLWKRPLFSLLVLGILLLGCIMAESIMNHHPSDFYLANLNEPPNTEFYFGTDSLGRDIFSIIWYGGRVSLFIGFSGMAILTCIGVFYGCLSGMAPAFLDNMMMRTAEMLSSIPNLLLILLILSIAGKPTPISIAAVIGGTSWMSLARIVRSEVRQIRASEYILVAKSMGASFPRILYYHLLPNFLSAIMFVVVSSISSCIMLESTLSFLGLGLPVEVVSWGSMLSLSNKALLTNSWWVILIPGVFIVVTLLCITNIGHYLRGAVNRRSSNL
jgi:peptide/nickel transport system permease protein